MRSILVASITALLLGACSTTFEKSGREGRAVVVWEETGVSINRYSNWVHQYDRENVQVEILGSVSRAGTILLGAKKVCVAETAQIGFHGPFPGAPQRIAEPFLQKVAAFYPPLLERSIVDQRSHERDSGPTLSGLQVHRLDPSIPICGPSVRTTTWGSSIAPKEAPAEPVAPPSPIMTLPLD